jgi:hypothetical protein
VVRARKSNRCSCSDDFRKPSQNALALHVIPAGKFLSARHKIGHVKAVETFLLSGLVQILHKPIPLFSWCNETRTNGDVRLRMSAAVIEIDIKSGVSSACSLTLLGQHSRLMCLGLLNELGQSGPQLRRNLILPFQHFLRLSPRNPSVLS